MTTVGSAAADSSARTGLDAASDSAFTTQPQPQTVPDGGSVTFSAASPGARLYTWYRTNAKGRVPLVNTNTPNYTFPAKYADNGATY